MKSKNATEAQEAETHRKAVDHQGPKDIQLLSIKI